jgi:hypothetical protein
VRVRVFGLVFFLASLTMTGMAQEGFPLIGTWSGDWGPTAAQRTQVLIEMAWDGKIISGTINPGYPDAAPLQVATLDSTKWAVHLEADSRDDRGNSVRVIVDGKLENIGSPNRTLSGTWTRGNVKGAFKLTRQ